MAVKKLNGIITANDLLGGHVVYLTKNKNWSPNISDAKIFTPQQEGEALAAVAGDINKVGIYWSQVEVVKNKITPIHFREKFRARGFIKPTGVTNVSI